MSEKVLEGIFSSLLMTFFFFQTRVAPTQIQPTVSYFHLRIAMDWIRLSFTSSIVCMPYTVTTVTAQHLVGDTTFTSPTMQVRTQTLTQTWVNYVQLAGYKYGDSNTKNLLAGSYNFQPHEVEVFYQTFKN